MSGKNTRRALLTSALAILACVAMLVGTTFAWFTDTASTAVNTIQAGNLHVKVMYSTDMKEWKDVEANTKLLDGDALWEPGHTQIVYLKVVNAGNLALKYEIRTNSYARGDRGKNADGKFFYVDTYLRIGLAETQAAFATRDAALADIADNEHAMAKRLQLTNGWTTLDAEEESGAYAMVMSDQAREKVDDLSRSMTYLELSTTPGYMDEFMAACFLPHTNAELFPSCAGH